MMQPTMNPNIPQQQNVIGPPTGQATMTRYDPGTDVPRDSGSQYSDTYSITQGANPLAGGSGSHSLDNYLGTDTTYQSQLSDLMRQFDQYNAQKNLAASQTQADYDAKQRSLQDQSTQDQLNMRNAAASRGILYSGIYANQLGQYNTANQQQLTDLLGGLQNSKDTANLAYNQFVANEVASKQNAIQQAAARRAAQLGQF
jgi:hypothetical protein